MDTPQPLTLAEHLREMERQFAAAGSDSPSLDARLLTAHVTGLTRAGLISQHGRVLDAATSQALTAVTARRVAREPVSRIIGQRGFWSLGLMVTPATLDPRPDTETVVEVVLAAVSDRRQPLRILDLGTGTGCLLLSLLSEMPEATGIGLDISAEAAAVAEANAKLNQLDARACFAVGSWAAPAEWADGRWDIIVSNPPYLSAADMAALEPEVRYDPPTALASGEDGLDDYRLLAPLMHRLVVPGGLIALEVGIGQSEAVAALLRAAGFAEPWFRNDLSGITRVVAASR